MIVIDASALVDALVGVAPSPDLLRSLAAEPLHAPTLVDFEVASALRGHVLARRITSSELGAAVETFASFRVERHQMTDLLWPMLALRDNFTVYDAAYVVLAQALEAPLVTCDRKLLEAGRFGLDVHVH